MSTVTLLDGREVASVSPEWMDECLQRHRHVLDRLVTASCRHHDVSDGAIIVRSARILRKGWTTASPEGRDNKRSRREF